MPRNTREDSSDDDEEETHLLLAPPQRSSDSGSSCSSRSSSSSGGSGAAPHSQHPHAAAPSALVIPALAPTTDATAKAPSLPGAQSLSSPNGKDISICRICLEEDTTANLDTPCGCSGTQRHAHQPCIQRWVEEKGHLRCEICGQQYKGHYTAPPPRPPPEAQQLLPLMIVDPDNPNHRITIHHSEAQLLDDSLDQEYQRHPGMNFIFTTCVFILFLVVLHHTVGVTDTTDDGSAPLPSPPPPTLPDDTDPSMADGIAFFLFWIFTKVLLIGIPLWTIMRVAQRQAEQQQYEELMMRGGDANRRIVVRVHAVRGPELATPAGIHAV